MLYKVLWFDDEYETKGINTIDNALEEDIELIGVSNAELGIELLKANPNKYDAILLDGLFFINNSDDENITDFAFAEVSKVIRDLKTSGLIIPWFVYSGQTNFVKSKNNFQSIFQDENFGKRTYDKNSDQDQVDLWQDIKSACDKSELTNLKHKYSNIFYMCEREYLGEKQFNRVYQIIKDIEYPENIYNPQDSLNPIRKVIEALFKKLNRIGLIPNEVLSESINGCNTFLACKNDNYYYHEELIHPIIAESLRHILAITQDGSHDEGKYCRADTYFSESSNTIMYQSLCMNFIEILDFFKEFIDNNPEVKDNQSKWEKIDKSIYPQSANVEGIIEQDENGNYYYGDYLFNYSYVNGKFPIGTKILILEYDNNSKTKTKEQYPYFVTKFETIN